MKQKKQKQKEYEVDIHVWHEGHGYYTLSRGKLLIAKALTLDGAMKWLRSELENLEDSDSLITKLE